MQTFRYLKNTAILKLDESRCIGCGQCVVVCPHRIFQLDQGKARIVDLDACMECGACATNCPAEAIFVNPDDGCGCATLLINRWIAKLRGKEMTDCGC